MSDNKMGIINFGDDQTFNMTMMDFSQTQQFLDANADLNSFFPRTGLTPRLTPRTGSTPRNYNGDINAESQYISWNNGSQIFDNEHGSYFPQVPSIQESIMTESPDNTHDSPVIPEAFEVPAKPKRGRPRKSRAKKQLSEEQEQENRRKFLERNRQAASKCRERRKEWISKQDDKLKTEQMENVKLRAEYEILSQEVRNLLRVIHQHTEAGCQSKYLKEFLISGSSRQLASLVEPGHRAFEDSLSRASKDHDQDNGSLVSGLVADEMLRQTSQVSDDKDSGITNMGTPEKSWDEVSNNGFSRGNTPIKMVADFPNNVVDLVKEMREATEYGTPATIIGIQG